MRMKITYKIIDVHNKYGSITHADSTTMAIPI